MRSKERPVELRDSIVSRHKNWGKLKKKSIESSQKALVRVLASIIIFHIYDGIYHLHDGRN